MYSLVVWRSLDEITRRTFSIPVARFLEYTDEGIASKLKALSNEAVGALAKWPMLVMAEGQTNQEAHIVFADSITPRKADVVVRLRRGELGPILNEHLWRLRRTLDIADWEFSRSHWAVKDVDLAAALSDAGFSMPLDIETRGSSALITPGRSELVAARSCIASLSHQGIDDLLALAGVEQLHAGRSVGSRADRASAIIQFALDNPGAMTAEKQLFAAFLLEQLAALGGQPEARPIARGSRDPKRVFVVHGRNQQVKEAVVAYLLQLQLEPVVLHDQPNMGRHLLTKFIEEAELATFAVVLMTDDDIGGRDSDSVRPRARQNVILELGYFLSRLGQSNVCALVSPGLETPSDFDGIVYVPIDDADRWRVELARELEAAKLPVAREEV